MRIVRCLMGSLLATALAGTARADTVPVLRPPILDGAALREAIPAGVRAIGVLRVGELDPGTAAARDAVADTLRVGGYRVRLIGVPAMTLASLTEADVSQLCTRFQVDLVAVVRTSALREGVRAEVELRDRAGRVIGAKSPTPTPTPTPAPARVASADPQVLALGEALYAREAIAVVGDEAYQGPVRRRLEGADFYTTVGRPDLAERYREREGTKALVRGAGGVTIGVGVLWGLADLLFSAAETVGSAIPCVATSALRADQGSWCDPHQPSGAPWVVAALGAGMLIIPSAIPSDPVSPDERQQLIERHNDEAHARAGLGPRPAAARPSMRIAPVVSANGGGVVVSGWF
jgi:hypothetical protein